MAPIINWNSFHVQNIRNFKLNQDQHMNWRSHTKYFCLVLIYIQFCCIFSMKRGVFILFEGVDRCGKSTQSAMLAKSLSESQRQAELIRFPERSTTIGNLIDLYLKSANNLNDQSIHLLFSANRWERSSFIEDSLKEGRNLVRIFMSFQRRKPYWFTICQHS